MKLILPLFILSISIFNSYAQNDQDSVSRIFELGEVTISGSIEYEPVLSINRLEILKYGSNNLSEAIDNIPGIYVDKIGTRNESSLMMRGFDSRQVAILIDGIPVYSNYDGAIDLSRFLSWNYEKISISKGFTSLLYGPNTMGGAINLVSSKPSRPFELDFNTGLKMGRNGYNGIANNLKLGGKRGNFFYQGGVSYSNLKSWSVSKNYVDKEMLESGRRDNSDEKDLNLNLRVGYSRDENNEYVISYNRMDGSKGVPTYEGDIQSPRYWKMPDWDKESVYFSSKTKVSPNSSLLSRVYLDKFYNLLESYDDSSYTTQSFRYAFNSIYDDMSYGANLNYNFFGVDNHSISLATQFKRDQHSEQSGSDIPFLNFSDNTFSIAIEDAYELNQSMHFIGGLSWNLKSNTGAEEYFSESDSIGTMDSGSDKALNYRIGTFFNPTKNHKIWLSYSANSRFSTLKERYSYRMGRSIANPDLEAERANHLIFGYRYKNKIISVQTELFHISSINKIAYTNIDPNTIQYQNIEKSLSIGADLQLGIRLESGQLFNFDYSYLKIENPEDPDFKFINIPNHNLRISSEIRISDNTRFHLQYNYLSSRYSYTDGSFKTNDYGLVNAGLNFDIENAIGIQLLVYNLLDTEYYYTEGFPAEGINVRLGLRYSFR
ncbi:MAG: TonB-dependent receptor [Bacteroidales bacterium]|nr:TonB-dependent receptor [Bacteroidales bacterium]MCF8391786.1 TonB-dependent receptor [Bacteroidales bacterium]